MQSLSLIKMIRKVRLYQFIGLIVLAFFYSCNSTPKVGYVESALVYEGFNGTKEVIQQNQQILVPRKNRIDSLKVMLLSQQNLLSDKTYNNQQVFQSYMNGRQLYDSLSLDYDRLREELEIHTFQKSWKLINEYIKAFGEENGYQIIHGVSGNGNIMYAQKDLNITDAVITYVNNSYEGN